MATKTNHDQRQANRHEYEHVLGMIEYNTGGPQPAMMDVRSLMTIASHSNIDIATARSRLQAAQENDDIIVYREETLRVARSTVESLEAIIEEQVESEHPDRRLIGECNRRLQDLRGGRDE